MQKVTIINDDGSTQDFFPQSYTDAAVAAVTPDDAHQARVQDKSEVDHTSRGERVAGFNFIKNEDDNTDNTANS